jgi:hypothetical protein
MTLAYDYSMEGNLLEKGSRANDSLLLTDVGRKNASKVDLVRAQACMEKYEGGTARKPENRHWLSIVALQP